MWRQQVNYITGQLQSSFVLWILSVINTSECADSAKKSTMNITKLKLLWRLFARLFQNLSDCGILWNNGCIEELTNEKKTEEEEEERRRQCLSKREFCGMTWLEARVVKRNTMFHQSGSYQDICLSKQPLRQFKHHRHQRRAADSGGYSHNIRRVSRIRDCDIIFFPSSVFPLVHWLLDWKARKNNTHTPLLVQSPPVHWEVERASIRNYLFY